MEERRDASGTVLVKDIRRASTVRIPDNLTNVNGTLFFTAYDDSTSEELWKSDGTAAGTVLVKDIRTGPSGSIHYRPSLVECERDVILQRQRRRERLRAVEERRDVGRYGAGQGHSPGLGQFETRKRDGCERDTILHRQRRRERARSCGRATGRRPVRCWSGTFAPAAASAFAHSHLGNLVNVNGSLFFGADDGATGYELWKSDGTSAGTVRVKDIRGGSTAGFLSRNR